MKQDLINNRPHISVILSSLHTSCDSPPHHHNTSLLKYHSSTWKAVVILWCLIWESNTCTFVWCDFDRASSLICGNKMPTRCNRGFYCKSYCLLNMFRTPLCPSSGAQKYYRVVAVCGISCCSILQTGHITLSSTPDQLLEKTTAQNTTRSNHCIILLSSWWWA